MRRPWRDGLCAAGLLLLVGARSLAAQVAPDRRVDRLTLGLRGVPVAEALDRFAAASGVSLAFDPAAVGTRRVFCQVDDVPPEEMLRCIVREAGLDFYQLSSGTYVVIASIAEAPQIAALVGQVMDATSGEPITRARVTLDAAVGSRAVNEGGTFRFASLLPGRYQVRVQAVGYRPLMQTLDLRPGREDRWRFALDPLPPTLSLVEVTGLTVNAAPQRTGAQRVVPDSVPAVLASAGLLRAAANQLGIGQRALAGDLHIQGGEAGEHQFRLDGVPVFDPVSVARMFGAFAPLAIRQLTVHKAGFGVSQGSYTAGVIDLEHSVGAGAEGVTTTIDPMAASLRLGGRGRLRGRTATGMLAARRSVWDVAPMPSVEQALHGWARVDPLLLDRAGATSLPFDRAEPFRIDKSTPTLRFLDVHGAGRVELGAFQSVASSFFVSDNAVSADVQAVALGEATPARTLDTRDAYAWRTAGGMLRHDWMPTARVQQMLRLRVSTHALVHRHHALAVVPSDSSGAPAADRRETNGVQEYALDAVTRIAATDRGELVVGGELARTGSHMDMNNGVFRPMQNASRAWRVSQFTEWRQQWAGGVQADAGLRLTWVPTFASVYAEPRLSLRGEHERDAHVFAWRIASGVHRQFVSQFDLPALGPTAVASGVRFWLPVDGSIRPAESYHATGEFVWRHARGFEVRTEAYHKWLTGVPALDFAVLLGEGGAIPHDVPQAMFVGRSRGRTLGAGVQLSQRARWGRASVGVDGGHSVRTFPGRFEGREQRTPWNESLRITSSIESQLPGDVALSLQSRSVWGRAWALRRAYYDLALDGLPVNAPGGDALPAWHEVDVAVAREVRIGSARTVWSVSALNALGRANVMDQWLVPALNTAGNTRVSRTGVGRQLLVTMRVQY
jgi:hypothetical protein